MLDSFSKTLLPQIDELIKSQFSKKEPQYLYEPIFYTLANSGKKIRPLLLLLFADYYQAQRSDSLKSAAAIELFHIFSLVHDDIMDEDELRRGQATVHKKWDEATAILAGDGLIAMANIMNASLNCEREKEITIRFNQTVLDVCEGQAFDKEFEKRKTVTVDEYLNMIRLKTACLIASSCQLGSLLGKANERETQAAYDLGMAIGMAFQIQDDILDLYADEKTLGKDIASDLLNDKKSILTVLARQKTSLLEPKDYERKEDFIAASKNLFETHKIYEEAIKIKNSYSEKAEALLSDLKESKEKRILNELILKLNNRVS